MRTYEFALVLKEEKGKEATAKKLVDGFLSPLKGKVGKLTSLGVRDFAYPIKKATRGWYGIYKIELPENQLAKLEKAVNLKEEVLRYLLVRVD